MTASSLLADTHVRFGGEINGMALEKLSMDRNTWISEQNARTDWATYSIIINYELKRTLIVLHHNRTFVETKHPFQLDDVVPAFILGLNQRDIPLQVAKGQDEGFCKHGQKEVRISLQDEVEETICFAEFWPGVTRGEIAKLHDLDVVFLAISHLDLRTTRSLSDIHGFMVQSRTRTDLGYQELDLLLKLEAVSPAASPWNHYGIPEGYEEVEWLDVIEMSHMLSESSLPTFPESLQGQQRHRIQISAGHRGAVTAARYTDLDQLVVSGGADGSVRVWDLQAGSEIISFEGHTAAVTDVDSLRNAMVASADDDGNVALWSISSGEPLSLHGLGSEIRYLRGVRTFRWSLEHERFLVATESRVAVASPTPRCNTTSVLSTGECRDVEPSLHQPLKFVAESGTSFTRIQEAPLPNKIATSDDSGLLVLWDGEDGRMLWRKEHGGAITDISFSKTNRYLAAVDDEGELSVWSLEGEEVLRRTAHEDEISAVRFLDKPGEIDVATAGHDGRVKIWSLSDGRLRKSLEIPGGAVLTMDATGDGEYLLTGSEDGALRHLRVETGEPVRTFRRSLASVEGLQFLDARSMVVEYDGLGTYVWDLAEGTRRRSSEAPIPVDVPESERITNLIDKVEAGDEVTSLAVATDESLLATATADGQVQLWGVESDERLLRLFQFIDGSWLVVDPEGRFDSDRPGDLPGASWVLAGRPQDSFPIESFLREYFTPGLLPKTIHGMELPEIAGLDSRNTLRPRVEIVDVRRDEDDASRVEILVDVKNHVLDPRMGAVSGARDLRLFRNGRQIATFPSGGGDLRFQSGTDVARIAFKGVQLPRDVSVEEITFETYAFNSELVKSETDRFTMTRPEDLSPRRARAYLVHVGADEYQNDSLDLSYAANDAKLFGTVMSRVLRESGAFEEVTPVILTSESGSTVSLAEKSVIQAVIRRLAGDSLQVALPGGELLPMATPDDLLILSLSGHAVVDPQGTFYFLPASFNGDLTEAVSSEELARWLQDVNVDEIVLIVDACYSAASIDSGDFRPGPMGSRGLGELAYGKAMRVLAASQKDTVAIESAKIRHGVLTYALLHDGLMDGGADFDPKDGKIYMAEWLRYAVDRVPTLYREVVGNERGVRPHGGVSYSQVPRLFDFTRSRSGPVLKAEAARSP